MDKKEIAFEFERTIKDRFLEIYANNLKNGRVKG